MALAYQLAQHESRVAAKLVQMNTSLDAQAIACIRTQLALLGESKRVFLQELCFACQTARAVRDFSSERHVRAVYLSAPHSSVRLRENSVFNIGVCHSYCSSGRRL